MDMEFYNENLYDCSCFIHLGNQLWKPRILIAFYNEFNELNNIGPHMSDYHMGLVAKNLYSVVCEQQRPRPGCVSAQSDQRLCYSLIGKYHI